MPQRSNPDKTTYTKRKTSGRRVMMEENQGKKYRDRGGEEEKGGEKKRTKE